MRLHKSLNLGINRIFKKQTIRGFAFDVEILLIAERQGFRVKEVPVRWLNSSHSKVHIVRDPVFMLYDVFRIRFYDFMKRYSWYSCFVVVFWLS
jgi:dolichyl-phosphate beta-glucosyltransferase